MNMVEKLARAVEPERFARFDAGDGRGVPATEFCSDSFYRARAALEAIRWLNDDVVMAVGNAARSWGRGFSSDDVWQAGIDAILSEQPSPPPPRSTED